MRLSEALKDKSKFVVVTELTGGPDFSVGPIEKFLKAYKEAGSAAIPAAFNFVGITSPQNPGGVANIEPADVLGNLKSKDLLGELCFIPHISCKDQNSNSLISSLAGLRKAGMAAFLR